MNSKINNIGVEDSVIVVSGLPRSGTSMMMKMLEAGGLQIVTDNERKPDEDNPKGYYELEIVKKLRHGDVSWIPNTKGKVVKIIASLIEYLPEDIEFKVIFMERSMSEILASQKKMLERRGENPDKISDDQLAQIFSNHLVSVFGLMDSQKNINYIKADYNQLIVDPESMLKKIIELLNYPLNIEEMKSIVDPILYRQKSKKIN